jgi:hypothetical protein
MPLVFIHGVSVRQGTTPQAKQAWTQYENTRNASFRTIAFAEQVTAPATLHIENPYWGDLASTFAWNLASVPTGDIESLGPEAAFGTPEGQLAQLALATTTAQAAEATPAANQTLVTLAKQASLVHAVDAVVGAAMHTANTTGATDSDLAQFAALAVAYAEANPKPAWLNNVTNDSAFLDQLTNAISQWVPTTETAATTAAPIESLGGLSSVTNWLKAGAQRLGNALTGVKNKISDVAGGVVGHITEPLVSAARPGATTMVGRFVGDVFIYLQNRGTKEAPGPIVQKVLGAIDAAIAQKKPGDDKLIILGHSMGGNIAYDILTYFRPDIQCDLFLTIGSQVALFEELKIFKQSDAAISAMSATKAVVRPANIGHWINVFDLTDIFGFTTEGVFAEVDDYKFDAETLPVLSHSMYFERARFYARLRERINAALK